MDNEESTVIYRFWIPGIDNYSVIIVAFIIRNNYIMSFLFFVQKGNGMAKEPVR